MHQTCLQCFCDEANATNATNSTNATNVTNVTNVTTPELELQKAIGEQGRQRKRTSVKKRKRSKHEHGTVVRAGGEGEKLTFSSTPEPLLLLPKP